MNQATTELIQGLTELEFEGFVNRFGLDSAEFGMAMHYLFGFLQKRMESLMTMASLKDEDSLIAVEKMTDLAKDVEEAFDEIANAFLDCKMHLPAPGCDSYKGYSVWLLPDQAMEEGEGEMRVFHESVLRKLQPDSFYLTKSGEVCLKYVGKKDESGKNWCAFVTLAETCKRPARQREDFASAVNGLIRIHQCIVDYARDYLNIDYYSGERLRRSAPKVSNLVGTGNEKFPIGMFG